MQGRMLDDMEAEEMKSAISKMFLKGGPGGGGGTPYVMFNVNLSTNRRKWTIERRYSDFVWLHDVSFYLFYFIVYFNVCVFLCFAVISGQTVPPTAST